MNSMFCRRRALAFLFVAGIFLVHASAYADTNATVSGLVTDPQGRAVVDTAIALTNVNTGIAYQTKTNGEGIYRLNGLQPGIYRANVSKDGFKSLVKADIELHVQDQLSINFALQLGSVMETVTVKVGAPLVNTQDASVSTVVDRNFAENLPMNGRSFQTLIELTPGVIQTPSEGQFSVNGQRGTSNYWMVDGVSANFGVSGNQVPGSGAGGAAPAFSTQGGTNSLVSVDALQEFRIQTSTYAPEFGRTPGAQISIETRSGTNQFHGSAFDYFRNDVLDASNWFNGYTNNPPLHKAEERQNDFGGVLGGPIVRNKTFFFFSYEGLRLRLPNTVITTVPSLASRQNAIPDMQPIFAAFPMPNPGAPDINGVSAFSASYSEPSTLNATSLRVDHRLSDKLLLFGRYDYSPSAFTVRQNIPTELSANRITTQTATVGATWTISSTSTNDLRFNYSRSTGTTYFATDTFGGAVPPPASALPFPSPFTTRNSFIGYFILSGIDSNTLIEGETGHNLQRQINLVDNLSIQKGPHSVKFGIDYRRLSPLNAAPAYTQTNLFLDFPSAVSGTLALATVSPELNETFLLRNLGLFGQDTWRLGPRLTLTYGLRWDVDFTPTTTSGPNFPAVRNFGTLPQLALAPSGTPPYNTKFGNLAPRVGVAYQLSQKPGAETVVRGGWGIFYDLATQQLGSLVMPGTYPFGATSNVLGHPFGGTATYPLSSAEGAPPPISVAQLASGGTLAAFDPALRLPYTMQWNVAIQRSLGGTQSLSATYLGSTGRRLLQTEYDSNVNQNISNAYLVSNQGSSDYNALQLQFQRRVSHGLQALASYTWSHSIDTASNGSASYSSIFIRQVGANSNRGSSDFDVRQAVSTGITYEIPPPGINAVAKEVLRGWSLQNVFQANSATPVNVLSAVSFLPLITGQARPDIVTGIPLYLYGSQYPGGRAINDTPGAVVGGCPDGSQSVGPFCPPPVDPTTGLALRQGDLGRNAFRGFWTWQWDLAVHRDFPIHEALVLQFRAEMFNVLNHPNFAPPDGFIGDTGFFGKSTQMLGQSLDGGPGGGSPLIPLYQIGGPRSIQLALKLQF
jgi:outer membrane receptor protein involved in Fe transport